MLYNYLVLPNNIIFMTICLENCNKYVAGIKVNVYQWSTNVQKHFCIGLYLNAYDFVGATIKS